ncbi:MAG TPA: DinB family protein [Bryobacteraceae bacterium]|jgi:hypothetical protein|nr:DinB family protein [Bryobacteraceae bacterium]
MNSQLAEVQSKLRANADRARKLSARAGAKQLTTRPRPEGWSAEECLAHLTMTTEGLLPMLRSALTNGRTRSVRSDGPFRMDMLGRMLVWALEPPPRFKAKAPPTLQPRTSGDEVAKFMASQERLLELVPELDGLALDRMKVPSPASPKLRYNVLSSLMVTVAHQRRHLWQAERAAGVASE